MRTHKPEHMHTHTKQKLKELNIKPDMHTIIYGQFHGPFPVKLICKEILLWANIPGDLLLVEADGVGLTGRNACFITGLQWGARLMIVAGMGGEGQLFIDIDSSLSFHLINCICLWE